MKNPQPSHTKTVAVVGTGMAGLATAHLLHQDPQKRYQVTLIEKVGSFWNFCPPKSTYHVAAGGRSSRY